MFSNGGRAMSDANTPGASAAAPEKVGVIVIHGVGDAEVGWINDYIVSELKKHETQLEFEDYSRVYRLSDLARMRKRRSLEVPEENKFFRSVMRRARLGDRADLAFAELHWADMSEVGETTISRLINILKLFFEAPHILGVTLLQDCSGVIQGLIRQLILTALWLLRWPIAGLQMAIFGSAFGFVLLKQTAAAVNAVGRAFGGGHYPMIITPAILPLVVVMLLLATAAAGFVMARWRATQDIGLTGLGLTTAFFSSALIVVTILLTYVIPTQVIIDMLRFVVAAADSGLSLVTHSRTAFSDKLQPYEALSLADSGKVETYLAVSGWMIVGVWAAWNLVVVSAVVLISAVGLSRIVVPSRSRGLPLRRPASAVGLAIIQAILWKLVICPMSIVVILMLVPTAGHGCRDNCTWSIDGFFGVDDILVRMVIISFLNAIVSVAIGLLVLALSGLRASSIANSKRDLLGVTKDIPRLIVNSKVLAFLLLCNIVTITVYYFGLGSSSQQFIWITHLLAKNEAFYYLRLLMSGTAIATLAPYAFAAFHDASRSMLHIARDLVDHHYNPRFAMMRLLVPGAALRRGPFPRRMRVQARLQELMSEVIVPSQFDRLVFLTHSQGSVIMHDYLRSAAGKDLVESFRRIDIVTLASPLSHLYQHYFQNYETTTMSAHQLNPKLATWTNMWRIDDPIGNRVDIVKDDFIVNVQLGQGGHVNYWKEPEVCAAILDVIDPARITARTTAAAPSSGTAPTVPPLFPMLTAEAG